MRSWHTINCRPNPACCLHVWLLTYKSILHFSKAERKNRKFDRDIISVLKELLVGLLQKEFANYWDKQPSKEQNEAQV